MQHQQIWPLWSWLGGGGAGLAAAAGGGRGAVAAPLRQSRLGMQTYLQLLCNLSWAWAWETHGGICTLIMQNCAKPFHRRHCCHLPAAAAAFATTSLLRVRARRQRRALLLVVLAPVLLCKQRRQGNTAASKPGHQAPPHTKLAAAAHTEPLLPTDPLTHSGTRRCSTPRACRRCTCAAR